MTWKLATALLLSCLCIACGGDFYNLRKSEVHYYRIDTASISDSEVSTLINPYQKELEAEMGKTIGYCKGGLEKEQPEGSLGNWAADAILAQAELYLDRKMDFAVVNNGGLRIPNISEGDISLGKMYELMPFDNLLVAMELPGSVVIQLAEHIAANAGWPISEAMQITVSPEGVEVSLNGEPIDPKGQYSMVISDYLANGGDKCEFFKELPQIPTNKLFREALIERVQACTAAGESVESSVEGRVKIVQ